MKKLILLIYTLFFASFWTKAAQLKQPNVETPVLLAQSEQSDEKSIREYDQSDVNKKIAQMKNEDIDKLSFFQAEKLINSYYSDSRFPSLTGRETMSNLKSKLKMIRSRIWKEKPIATATKFEIIQEGYQSAMLDEAKIDMQNQTSLEKQILQLNNAQIDSLPVSEVEKLIDEYFKYIQIYAYTKSYDPISLSYLKENFKIDTRFILKAIRDAMKIDYKKISPYSSPRNYWIFQFNHLKLDPDDVRILVRVNYQTKFSPYLIYPLNPIANKLYVETYIDFDENQNYLNSNPGMSKLND